MSIAETMRQSAAQRNEEIAALRKEVETLRDQMGGMVSAVAWTVEEFRKTNEDGQKTVKQLAEQHQDMKKSLEGLQAGLKSLTENVSGCVSRTERLPDRAQAYLNQADEIKSSFARSMKNVRWWLWGVMVLSSVLVALGILGGMILYQQRIERMMVAAIKVAVNDLKEAEPQQPQEEPIKKPGGSPKKPSVRNDPPNPGQKPPSESKSGPTDANASKSESGSPKPGG